jgi:maleate isomerase
MSNPDASAIPGRTRLGMLTPSSNSVLEPVSARMLADMPEVTVHASRFRVTQIGLSPAALDQFATDGMVAAADLLADAKVGSIMWNGTSAAWLGFESDERLASAITARTGIPASSSVLAFRDLFRRAGASRIGLVTPYTADVQERIMANWGAAGFACPAERHAGLSENFAFARLTDAEIADMVRAVAGKGVDAVAIVCTNMAGAFMAPSLEAELGIPVYDSVAVTLWKALTLAGCETGALARWGQVFSS